MCVSKKNVACIITRLIFFVLQITSSFCYSFLFATCLRLGCDTWLVCLILTAYGCLLSSPARFRCAGRDRRWSARRVARFFAVGRRNRSELSGLFGGHCVHFRRPLELSALVDLLHCPYYQGVPESVFCPNPVLNSGPVPTAGSTVAPGYRPSNYYKYLWWGCSERMPNNCRRVGEGLISAGLKSCARYGAGPLGVQTPNDSNRAR